MWYKSFWIFSFLSFYFSNFRYKFSVLALTYVAYTCYHLTRKPISVVKTVLHRNCSLVDSTELIRSVTDPSSEETWCDYAPFGRFYKKKTTKTYFFIINKQKKNVIIYWSSRPSNSDSVLKWNDYEWDLRYVDKELKQQKKQLRICAS